MEGYLVSRALLTSILTSIHANKPEVCTFFELLTATLFLERAIDCSLLVKRMDSYLHVRFPAIRDCHIVPDSHEFVETFIFRYWA